MGGVLASTALLGVSIAQAGINYQDEYDKKIQAAQNVGVLGDGLAGDHVNFYTGATTFSAVDIELPTNSLPLRLARTHTVGYDDMFDSVPGPDIYHREIIGIRKRSFLDWDLDVPAITTTMTQAGGWIVDTPNPSKRCSVVGQSKPDLVTAADGAPPRDGGDYSFHPSTYWSGYSMRTLAGEQSLLLASLPNAERPLTGGPYHWTTNQDWWVSCLEHAANDSGEGFLAISPEGVQYRFDTLSRRNVNSIMDRSERDPDGVGFQMRHFVFRAEYQMLASSVVDRFGNWLRYDWSQDAFARLRSISLGHAGSTVPDQTITVSYDADGFIASASDGTRAWKNTYDGSALVTVRLTDLSAWSYDFGVIGYSYPPAPYCDTEVSPTSPDYHWACFGGGEVAESPFSATVIHPSGARVDFVFKPHYQYGAGGSSFPLGIASKTITGAGLAPASWRFGYLPSKAEIRDMCHYTACPDRIMTDELAPDSSLRRRVYSTKSGEETVVLAEFQGSSGANGGGSPAVTTTPNWGTDILDDISPLTGTVPTFYSETDYQRAGPGPMPFTVRVGANPLLTSSVVPVQVYETERRLPVLAKYTRQQGVTFGTETRAFDNFARPLQVARWSTGSAAGDRSLQEYTTYRDDWAKWVIGQVTTRKVDAVEVSRTEFDASLDLPVKSWSYGFLEQTVAYNADGTVASVTDPLGHQTSVSGWRAGIPQLIRYPTGYSESAVVGPAGTIEQTVNESGSTTRYAYDDMGRLSRIVYPSSATEQWNDTTRKFIQVSADEFTMIGPHWKSEVRTGNGLTTTYFDGRWQPALTSTEDVTLAGSRSFVAKRFDGLGRETFSSYPVANAWDALTGVWKSYDALGRVTAVIQDSELGALSSTTEYLPGFVTRTTNPRGYQTSTQFQLFDAPSSDYPVQVDAPEGVRTVIQRDVFGKPVTITRSGPGGAP
jgi:YD repeat-containing protein